jgi:hypothetical protein
MTGRKKITTASCKFHKKGRKYAPIYSDLYDKRGLAIGNRYLTDFDGKLAEWTLIEIIRPIEPTYSAVLPYYPPNPRCVYRRNQKTTVNA